MRRSPPSRRAAVHPRTSGEQKGKVMGYNAGGGSSPHERGTEELRELKQLRERFIPARAGNSPCQGVVLVMQLVHPRTSGEQFWQV